MQGLISSQKSVITPQASTTRAPHNLNSARCKASLLNQRNTTANKVQLTTPCTQITNSCEEATPSRGTSTTPYVIDLTDDNTPYSTTTSTNNTLREAFRDDDKPIKQETSSEKRTNWTAKASLASRSTIMAIKDYIQTHNLSDTLRLAPFLHHHLENNSNINHIFDHVSLEGFICFAKALATNGVMVDAEDAELPAHQDALVGAYILADRLMDDKLRRRALEMMQVRVALDQEIEDGQIEVVRAVLKPHDDLRDLMEKVLLLE